MKIKEIMTKRVTCCTRADTAQDVAKIMKTHDIGAVPVVSDLNQRHLEGIVTDRDLCCSIVAKGKAPEFTPIEELMTRNPVSCSPEDNLDRCEKLMEKHRIRRVPVVDSDGCCIGIVTQADLAALAPGEVFRRVVAKISQPWRTGRLERRAHAA